MIILCPKCKDWGIAPDKLFFKTEQCPLCQGCKVIADSTEEREEEREDKKPLWKILN